MPESKETRTYLVTSELGDLYGRIHFTVARNGTFVVEWWAGDGAPAQMVGGDTSCSAAELIAALFSLDRETRLRMAS